MVNHNDLELELIEELLNNQLVDEEFIKTATTEIKLENLDLFLNIISNYNDLNIQQIILLELYNKLSRQLLSVK